MSDLEFGRFFMQLISGGLETTRNTLAYAFYEFWRHPDQYKAMQNDPALVAGAVEEILRFRNPVVYLRRTATMDHEFAGETIRKGDKMVCLLGSPNRDPELFENPDVFDITRNPLTTRQRIRTFGLGHPSGAAQSERDAGGVRQAGGQSTRPGRAAPRTLDLHGWLQGTKGRDGPARFMRRVIHIR